MFSASATLWMRPAAVLGFTLINRLLLIDESTKCPDKMEKRMMEKDH
jgi:hypothetical protein